MPENNLRPDKHQIRELIKAHLEVPEPECRWCFGVDLQRVEGKVTARYDFQDAMLLHLSCPRCGGEFTQYIPIWEAAYVTKVMSKLRPQLRGHIGDELFNEINGRIFPEYPGA